MNNFTTFISGAGLGAGLMYYLDPSLGPQRRAHARDQASRVPRVLQDSASVTARDLKNRTVGLVTEARARLTECAVEDEVLVERVRSQLGFLVRHPSAIEVSVRDGEVILGGAALSDEIEQLIDGVRTVRGVRKVDNQVNVHTDPNGIPSLQGDKPKPTGRPLDIMQRRWSPATRFLVGAAGLLLAYNVSRPGHRHSVRGEA